MGPYPVVAAEAARVVSCNFECSRKGKEDIGPCEGCKSYSLTCWMCLVLLALNFLYLGEGRMLLHPTEALESCVSGSADVHSASQVTALRSLEQKCSMVS